MKDNDGYDYETGQFDYYTASQANNIRMMKGLLGDKRKREKAKRAGIIMLIIGGCLAIGGLVLFFLNFMGSVEPTMLFASMPFLFLGFALFGFGLSFFTAAKGAENYLRASKNMMKQSPLTKRDDAHEFVSESDEHRFDAPNFNVDDRFARQKKEETKSEAKLDSKVCPKCGYINPSDAKFCCQCGSSFESKND